MGIFKRIAALLSDRYVLITKEEWDQTQKDLIAVTNVATLALTALNALPTATEFERLRSLAEQANILCEGMMPDSGIAARKVGNLVVTTGIPNSNQG